MKHLIIPLLMLLAISVKAQQAVTFAVEDSWPPYADRQGNGISKLLIEKAFKHSNYQLNFLTVPYARALQMTEEGIVNACFNVTRQNDTEKRFLFGDQVLLVAKASYFYPVNQVRHYQSIEQVPDGTSIGLIIGYEYGDRYEAHRHRFNEFRVSTQKQLIDMLKRNRIDMAIMFDEVAKYTLAHLPEKEHVIVKGALNHQSDIYVAFSRKKTESQALIKVLDQGLLQLKKSGENKWLN